MIPNKEIIIGGGLSAVLYAYCTDSVLLRSADDGPPPFDFFEADVDLSAFHITSSKFGLSSNSDYKLIGAPKRDLWERLSFMKSISGGIPFTDKVTAIRIDRETKVVTVSSAGASNNLEYDKLRIFDDKDLHGVADLQIISTSYENKKYKVFDWFDVRSGCRHKFDYISTEDDFVRELYFYPSDRVDGNHDLKDLVTVSYLDRQQLDSIEYSDTYARLKTRSIMKANGIRGTRNGRDTKNPEKFKYYAIRLESASREVYEIKKNLYRDDLDIIFDNRTPEQILTQVMVKPSYSCSTHGKLVTV
jgi:hypothetical protein|tara:strand:+ start:212 stop:1120 length:909 start_codon:yes stop_codon:yes gene_type:complete